MVDQAFRSPVIPYKSYAAVLACVVLGLMLIVVILVAPRPRAALVKVLPAVGLTLAASAAMGCWLLARRRAPGASMIALPMLAGGAAMVLAIAGLATLRGLDLHEVFARRIVDRALLVGPLLGAMVGLTLLLLVRARLRELAAWELELAARLANERLQRERALAQLQLLQAQVAPHFIYNTLANLRQLIRVDSTRALAMLEHLIRYFKLSLPSFHSERLPLGHELALVQTYTELLRERLGRSLRLQHDISGHWLEATLPPGALLCLAENALKHGLPLDGGELVMDIEARRDGPMLRLTMRDNGPGLGRPAHAESTGVGLNNLRERLRLAYGPAASIELANHANGCEAVLLLPWEAA